MKFAVDPQEISTDEPFFVIASADDDNGVRLIEILINGELLKQCFEPFCELEWSFPEQGKRVVEARVFDTAEQMTSERAVLTVYPREEVEETPKIYELALVTGTDEVIVGDCPGPKELRVVAEIPEEVLVERVFLRYQWEGIKAQLLEMERIDDFTFIGVLNEFDYCCEQTTLELLAQAYDGESVLVAEGWNKALLTFCIAVG